jgi:hypothetical protein
MVCRLPKVFFLPTVDRQPAIFLFILTIAGKISFSRFKFSKIIVTLNIWRRWLIENYFFYSIIVILCVEWNHIKELFKDCFTKSFYKRVRHITFFIYIEDADNTLNKFWIELKGLLDKSHGIQCYSCGPSNQASKGDDQSCDKMISNWSDPKFARRFVVDCAPGVSSCFMATGVLDDGDDNSINDMSKFLQKLLPLAKKTILSEIHFTLKTYFPD